MSRASLSGVLLGLNLAFLLAVWGLSPAARWVPLSIIIPTLALLSFQFVRDLRSNQTDNLLSAEARVVGWLLALPLLIYALGTVIAVPAYLLCYARARAGESWRYTLLLVSIAILLLFAIQNYLEIQLYGGLLWNWLS